MYFFSLPSVRDLILSRPGTFLTRSSRSLAELWWVILGAPRQILSEEEDPPEADEPSWSMYSPPRKCGRENVMEPMPITRTPEIDR